jgi:hypothetical protein
LSISSFDFSTDYFILTSLTSAAKEAVCTGNIYSLILLDDMPIHIRRELASRALTPVDGWTATNYSWLIQRRIDFANDYRFTLSRAIDGRTIAEHLAPPTAGFEHSFDDRSSLKWIDQQRRNIGANR